LKAPERNNFESRLAVLLYNFNPPSETDAVIIQEGGSAFFASANRTGYE
jgi:hypothetical protein